MTMTFGAELDLAASLVDDGPPVVARVKDHKEPTTRELHVAYGIARGRSLRQLSVDLRLGESTVRGHMQRIFRKAKVHSSAELVSWLYRNGYMGNFKPDIFRCPTLTPREASILRFLVLGLSNPELAKRLNTSTRNILARMHVLMGKFGAVNRNQLVAMCWQLGIPKDSWFVDDETAGTRGVVDATEISHMPVKKYNTRAKAVQVEENCPTCGRSTTDVEHVNLTRRIVVGSDGTLYQQDTIW